MTAILFDLDGTISNSISNILHACYLSCQDLNVPFEENTFLSYIGLPLLKTGELVLGKGREEEYYSTYQKHFFATSAANPLQPYEGMIPLLHQLKRSHVKLALVTSKSTRGTIHSLESLDLQGFFDIVVTSDSTKEHKPHPEPVLFGLQQLNETAQNGIFVGDSLHDMECGRAAGTRTGAVTWGANTKEELRTANPTFLADTPQELLDWLLQQI